MNRRSWNRLGGAALAGGLTLSVAASAAPAEAPRPPGSRRALVIGVGSYPRASGWRQLPGAPHDAQAFARLLVDRFHFAKEDVLVLRNEEATRARILESFENHLVEKARPDTIAVFFFAGHGSQLWDEDGDEGEGPAGLDETICPVDSVSRSPKRNDIRDDELESLFRRLNEACRQTIGIFDSCHSGTVMRDMDRRLVARRAPAEEPPDRLPRETAATGRRELALLSKQPWPGRAPPLFLLACRDNEEACETRGDGPARGVFSQALETALRGARPTDTWGLIHDQVRRHLFSRLVEDQNPVLFGPRDAIVLGGNFTRLPSEYEILKSTATGLRIAGGRVHGFVPGSRLLLTPREDGPDHAARVTTVLPTECLARLEQPLPPGQMVALSGRYRARFLSNPLSAPSIRIAWDEDLLAEQAEQRERLETWRKESSSFTVGDRENYDLLVLQRDENDLVVRDATGRTLLPHPFAPVVTPSKICAYLDALGVYRSTRALQNPGSSLGTHLTVEVVLGKVGKGQRVFEEDPNLATWSRDEVGTWQADLAEFSRQDCQPAIRFAIRNSGRRNVHALVLSLTPDWAVGEIPRSDRWIDAGEQQNIEIKLSSVGWVKGDLHVAPDSREHFLILFSTQSIRLGSLSSGLSGEQPPEGLALMRSSSPDVDWTSWTFSVRLFPEEEAP